MESIKVKKLFVQVGFWEGVSYLILLFLAMPLKYLLGYDSAVRIVGSLHGVLFIMFAGCVAWVWKSGILSFRQCLLALLLSFIPFGTFKLHKLS